MSDLDPGPELAPGRTVELAPGRIVWADLDPVAGREQGGRRPLLVVSSQDHLDTVTTLVTVVPITSRGRGWPNHVRLAGGGGAGSASGSGPSGLARESFAMTEQVRTISRDRVRAIGGQVPAETLRAVRQWLMDFLTD